MKRTVIIGLMVVAMAGLFAANQRLLLAGPATTAGETMVTANQLYDMGRYEQAAQAYQQLADKGHTDSALYYNLGNAYYKQGDIGRAILNYRRAQGLDPRDPDIEANLVMAREQAVDQFEVANQAGTMRLVGQALRSWLALNEVAMAALGLWILFVFLVLIYTSAKAGSVWRKPVRYGLIVVGVLLAGGVLALGGHLYLDASQAGGVIVASEVDITSGPGPQYVTEFTVHSGAEVNLVERRGNWVRLAAPGTELEGWVPASAVEPVSG
jgi:hypothetical protein